MKIQSFLEIWVKWVSTLSKRGRKRLRMRCNDIELLTIVMGRLIRRVFRSLVGTIEKKGVRDVGWDDSVRLRKKIHRELK